MADVVRRPVDALLAKRRLAGRGQMDSAGKDQVEENGSAVIGLAPDAEVLIELVVQPVGRAIDARSSP